MQGGQAACHAYNLRNGAFTQRSRNGVLWGMGTACAGFHSLAHTRKGASVLCTIVIKGRNQRTAKRASHRQSALAF